jgi:hypothetical protein
MAQIFISHSKKDKKIKGFFSDIFGGTNVRGVFEEFERIIKGEITREDIRRDIDQSRATFILLSENVEKTKHTRDWVLFESGASCNKDVWLFEPSSEYGKISVITPSLRHYVVFNTNKAWFNYIRRIVESYDDSQTLSTALIGGGLGALVGSALSEEEGSDGAVLGGIAGFILGAASADKSKTRPLGVPTECVKCKSIYNIHVSQGTNLIRCPVCNQVLSLLTSDFHPKRLY